jgi:hypothetical protein
MLVAGCLKRSGLIVRFSRFQLFEGFDLGDQYSMFETTVSEYAPTVTSRPAAMEPLTV